MSVTAPETFVRLFRGRADAYGSWPGGCVREELTPDHFQRHLHSADEADWIGVYNVINTRCSWGAVDIDTDDFPLARNIRQALHQRGVPAWIEQTTRGYHVWVFPADQLVNAATMRRALTAACKAVDYHPREVFPKQDRVSGKGFGNYVRLPFNGYCASSTPHHIPRTFMEFVHDGHWLTFEEFLSEMDTNRASTEALKELAELTPSPQAVDISVDYQVGLQGDGSLADLGGLAYRIWRDGPLHGNDRSTTLVHLARLLADDGTDPQQAMGVLRSADERWGKGFIQRGTAGELIMDRILAKAYAHAG